MAALTACANFLKLEPGNVLTDRCKPMESESRRRASGGGWKSSFTLLEKIFLTLVRLRRGIDLRLIGDLYGVSESTISRIFKTMVNYMYLRLGMLPIWPNPEHVSAHLPRIFRELYPSTFIVIDATELRCEVASSLPAQSQLYSAYKSHTTVKGFLGMTPDGAVSFVSEFFWRVHQWPWAGHQEPLSWLVASGYGTSLMADKGFDIQDLLVSSGVKLNIPPFKRAGQQMAPEDVQRTQRIAKVRIHIERLIERVKEFQILQKVSPVTLFPCVNQIWTVCCLLTLFQTRLVAADE